MEGTQRKPSKRVSEPIDEWLQSLGFFRKHAPKDPTCLFRAISEQVYLTQHFHIRVRRECVEFMKKHSSSFEKKVTNSFDNYLDQMACFTEWGGNNEIEAMSMLYKKEIIIFDGHTLTKKVVNDHSYESNIFLCYTAQKQYESVYTQEYITSAAFCQSLVYKTLYKDVFQMPNVDETVHKMLHDRSHSFKHEKFFSKGNVENKESSTSDSVLKIEEGCSESEDKLIHKGGLTPFPYRVAKALDPDIYRNTDFDIWHEIRREVRNSGFSKFNNTEFQVGGKCLVELNSKEDDLANNNDPNTSDEKTEVNGEETSVKLLTGHIQEMSKNEGPVIVFILELGEKRTVPYSTLRPIATKKTKMNTITALKKNPAVDQSHKFKKSFGSSTRKGKEQLNGCNHTSLNFERNSNKGTPNKKNNDNSIKWADEQSENNKASFEKHCTENYIPPDEDFTADLDFPQDIEKNARPMPASEENLKKLCSSSGAENNFQLQSQQQNPTFFLPPNENNNYPVFSYCENDVLPNVGFLLDQAVQPINIAVTKSVDSNCSDLPFTDLQTLRFFYNLGIQYYHAANWLCGSNQPPVVNGQFSFAMGNSAGQKLSNIPESQEDETEMANMQHKYTLRSKKENCENGLKETSPHRALKNFNTRFNAVQEPSLQNNNSNKTNKDYNKNIQYCNNEKTRDNINGSRDVQRNSRNGVPPRFKKCIDGRNRNFTQLPRRYQQRETEFHQGNNRFLGPKIEGKPYEKNGGVPGNRQNPFPHQVQIPMNNPIHQYSPNQPPLYPQPICNEADTYCPQSPGLIPLPYVHHVDSGDNNANSFPPVVYTGIDNYPQTFVPYYSPYAYPPQTIYPGMAPSNAQESWYQFPSHSHYIPSCVQYNPTPGTPPNGAM